MNERGQRVPNTKIWRGQMQIVELLSFLDKKAQNDAKGNQQSKWF